MSDSNSDVQKEISIITKLIQQQKKTEKELAKRMFSDPKSKVEPTKQTTKNKVG